MDSDRLNRWLTFGANLGVLIGIILLLVELDQNRDMMRAQTRNELSRGVLDLLGSLVENKELADVMVRANNGEELTPTERYIFGVQSERVFRYWENVHYQYRQGMYDESEFSKHLDTMQAVLIGNQALINFWCQKRSLYSAPFVVELDRLLAQQAC